MRDNNVQSVGYGLIGCGVFGQFSLEHYASMKYLRRIAVADARREAARAVGERFGLDVCDTPDGLLDRDDVDIVHIATPPFTHKELVLAAIRAGKHVLCEKPLATNVDDAREMVSAARQAGRVLAVNLIMRYNPLSETVKRIVDERLLGEPLHGFFENYAKDEQLGPEHWFWNREQSGGIFIEHGVHFFDLFRWWLGPGRVMSAQETVRPGTDIVEQVNCTAAYTDVLVNFYHGFHQATRMDRQEMRLLFERGSIRLFEWVPTRLELECIAENETIEALVKMVPYVEETGTLESYTGDERNVTSRHKSYEVDGRYLIAGGVGMTKPQLYGHVLRGLLADQVTAIRNPEHSRRVTEQNGLTSLEMAVRAAERAQTS